MTVRIVILLLGAALVGTVALVGVSSRNGDQPAKVAAPTTRPLPAPTGKVVLRITGVEGGNASARATKLDFATLDALARSRVTIREPFLKRDMTFTGVPMRALLSRAGVPGSARRLHLHALDDYTITIPIEDILADDAVLATRSEGKLIPVADGGPIRMIYPRDDAAGAISDNWIWSVDSMRAIR